MNDIFCEGKKRTGPAPPLAVGGGAVHPRGPERAVPATAQQAGRDEFLGVPRDGPGGAAAGATVVPGTGFRDGVADRPVSGGEPGVAGPGCGGSRSPPGAGTVLPAAAGPGGGLAVAVVRLLLDVAGGLYADTFARRSGLSDRACSVEDLAAVTRYFAQNAARLADQVPRDEAGPLRRRPGDRVSTGPEITKT